jgi:hypothetical protein
MDRIKRIEEMEKCLNVSAAAIGKLSAALEEYEAAQKSWKKLSDYYGSTRWMSDYEADEAGKLPADLKRGVLSEDAVYDLIIENRELIVRMLRLSANSVEKTLL